MKILTRNDWNDIIRQVNCKIYAFNSDVEPLPEVAADHVWTVDDVVSVRNKINEICDYEYEFNAPTTKWHVDILDEIQIALGKCCADYEFSIPAVYAGHEEIPYTWNCGGGYDDTYEFPVVGLEVGPPDIYNRYWYFLAQMDRTHTWSDPEPGGTLTRPTAIQAWGYVSLEGVTVQLGGYTSYTDTYRDCIAPWDGHIFNVSIYTHTLKSAILTIGAYGCLPFGTADYSNTYFPNWWEKPYCKTEEDEEEA